MGQTKMVPVRKKLEPVDVYYRTEDVEKYNDASNSHIARLAETIVAEEQNESKNQNTLRVHVPESAFYDQYRYREELLGRSCHRFHCIDATGLINATISELQRQN